MPCSDAYRLGYDPVALREQDTHQKLKMKCRAESKGAIRECDIQVGDTVLVKQPRRGKLSTPYHPTPLIVTDKNQSMLTVEGPNSKVTRNSSHFKRFMTGEPVTPLFRLRNLLLMLTWKTSPLSSAPTSCQKFADPGPIDPTDCAETSTEVVLRRSTRLPKPTKRLIQEI